MKLLSISIKTQEILLHIALGRNGIEDTYGGAKFVFYTWGYESIRHSCFHIDVIKQEPTSTKYEVQKSTTQLKATHGLTTRCYSSDICSIIKIVHVNPSKSYYKYATRAEII